MSPEAEKRRLILPLPDPGHVHFLEPHTPYKDLTQNLTDYLGPTKAIIGYGSGYNGTATPNSRLDAIVIVEDLEKFHQRNLKAHPEIYGLPHDPRYHAFWDQFGLTYYRADIPMDGEISRWKLVVISDESLKKLAYGSFSLGRKTEPTNPFEFGVQGRLQKVALAQITPVPDDVKKAIDQARLIGMTQVLGFLPKEFSLDQAEYEYANWSYKTDVRLEQPDKVKSIIASSQEDYDFMLTDILERLSEVKVVEQTGDSQYRRLFTPNPHSVNKLILEGRAAAVFSNYVKNLATGGVGSSLVYAKEKAERALKKRWDLMRENPQITHIEPFDLKEAA